MLDVQGGRGGYQIQTMTDKKGRGVKKSNILPDILCECPLTLSKVLYVLPLCYPKKSHCQNLGKNFMEFSGAYKVRQLSFPLGFSFSTLE